MEAVKTVWGVEGRLDAAPGEKFCLDGPAPVLRCAVRVPAPVLLHPSPGSAGILPAFGCSLSDRRHEEGSHWFARQGGQDARAPRTAGRPLRIQPQPRRSVGGRCGVAAARGGVQPACNNPLAEANHSRPAWHGVRPVPHGVIILRRGVRPASHGARPLPHGLHPASRGARPVSRGPRPMPCGVRPIWHGLRPVSRGVHPFWRGAHPKPRGVHPVAHGACPIRHGAHPMTLQIRYLRRWRLTSPL